MSYGKHIGLVAGLVRKAMEKGTAGDYIKGNYMIRVTGREDAKGGSFVWLHHYGTGICLVGFKPIPSTDEFEADVFSIGGYSASDRDAINTMLTVLGLDSKLQVRKEGGSLVIWEVKAGAESGKFVRLG